LGLVTGLLRLPWALWRAIVLVRRFAPQVAVSVGGYAAGPAVLAARLCGIPCVVMEQNAIPGWTNRVLARLARRVFAGLPVRGFAPGKVKVLGNPVRADLCRVRDRAYLVQGPPNLLVFGGSQGARALNEAMMGAASRLAALELRITHQTGEAIANGSRPATRSGPLRRPGPRLHRRHGHAYADADLVLCRAGP